MNLWETVASGAAGVAAGVVLAVLVRTWDNCRARIRRRKQVAAIVDLLGTHRPKIINAFRESVPMAHLRYDEFAAQLRRVLTQGCSELTFDERDELDEAMIRRHETSGWGDVSWVEERFAHAESMKWLGLSR